MNNFNFQKPTTDDASLFEDPSIEDAVILNETSPKEEEPRGKVESFLFNAYQKLINQELHPTLYLVRASDPEIRNAVINLFSQELASRIGRNPMQIVEGLGEHEYCYEYDRITVSANEGVRNLFVVFVSANVGTYEEWCELSKGFTWNPVIISIFAPSDSETGWTSFSEFAKQDPNLVGIEVTINGNEAADPHLVAKDVLNHLFTAANSINPT